LAEFRTASDLSGQSTRSKTSLERFFTDFARLRLALTDHPAPASISVDLVGLANFLETFGRDCAKLYRLGDFIDVWSVAGLNRVETRNAAVLAWLLDANGTHGRGSSILRALIERLAKTHEGKFPLPTEISGRYAVLTEIYPLDNTENRIDIAIDGLNFVAFVEVKIGAVEGDQQVSRYLSLAEAKAAGRAYCVIFLSPERASGLSTHSQFVVAATWKDVAHAIEDGVRNTSDVPGCFGDRLLIQFAQHAQQF